MCLSRSQLEQLGEHRRKLQEEKQAELQAEFHKQTNDTQVP